MRNWIAERRLVAAVIFAASLIAVAIATCCGVAFLQLSAIEDRTYDPVRDDGFRPEEVPALKRRLVWISGMSGAMGIAGIAGMWATRWGESLIRKATAQPPLNPTCDSPSRLA